jgi:hypothetical protein
MMEKYLTVVQFKSWVKNAPDNGVIEFYEVEAEDEDYARSKALYCFEVDYQYKPWIKKYMKQFAADLSDVCCLDAVKIS